MLMKKLLVLLIAMTGILNITLGQQVMSDSVAILGDWHLVSVQTEMFAQADGRLLEKKTVDPGVDGSQLKLSVPYVVRLTKDSCFLTARETVAGSYNIVPGGLLRVKEMADPRYPSGMKTYKYALSPGMLELTLPSIYYQDGSRKEAVKVTYHCQFRRN
jgi:hypothetical protein